MTREIPIYLQTFIAKQDPSLYTAIDHASWRFILRVSKSFFAKHAHQKYKDGLEATGISVESIPLISDMDRCLRKFNWRAVPVTGFIPPSAFMEFLSLGVLPIACDMRKIEHLSYTPAPDIVHEAAGHAPIIADQEYADYLRGYGEISQKAIFTSQDMDVYLAIRNLSDTKEDPRATSNEIEKAQKRLDQALEAVTEVSEAALLARMGWWTFEYGLLGAIDEPKIYGAGLLSSMSESFHCFDQDVKKIPFSVDCIEVGYDITRPQPQLFVAPCFRDLVQGLEELANRMAFRRGGVEGLEKAKRAATVTTSVTDSGVQVSGVLADFILDGQGKPCYLQFKGPTQIAYGDSELEGQGGDYHREGFGSPLGVLSEAEALRVWGKPGSGISGKYQFKSGVEVEGKLVSLLKKEGKLILLSFEACTVKKGERILFQPEWGMFDMVCGEKVVSVFGGAADRKRYLEVTGGFKQDPGQQKTNLTDENRGLNALYAEVRGLRESEMVTPNLAQELEKIYDKLEKEYPEDWLLSYEILEMSKLQKLNSPIEGAILKKLRRASAESAEKNEMITRGLEIL